MVKKDTVIFNPEAYRTPEGSSIEELIKRIPGAEVDEDGNITVNGKEVKKILLDGKEFMLGDIETALKNIPVSITSVAATFNDDPYLYVDDPLATMATSAADNPLAPYLVNYNKNASLTYGSNKNAWGMLQLYRRLNPHGRHVTFRVEASGGNSKN